MIVVVLSCVEGVVVSCFYFLLTGKVLLIIVISVSLVCMIVVVPFCVERVVLSCV